MESNDKINTNSYEEIILARLGEIALKGMNRGKFEGQLMRNIKWRIRDLGKFEISQSQSRIWIRSNDISVDLKQWSIVDHLISM